MFELGFTRPLFEKAYLYSHLITYYVKLCLDLISTQSSFNVSNIWLHAVINKCSVLVILGNILILFLYYVLRSKYVLSSKYHLFSISQYAINKGGYTPAVLSIYNIAMF